MSKFHFLQKSRKIKLKAKEEIDLEEIFGKSFSQIESPISSKKIIVLEALIFILTIVLLCRSAIFQIVQGKDYLNLAQKNQYLMQELEAKRGIIYDRNLIQLVYNTQNFSLYCQPDNLPKNQKEKENIIQAVSKILGEDAKNIGEKIQKNNTEIPISKNIPMEKVIIFSSRQDEFKGFELREENSREYYLGPTFSQVIGYWKGNKGVAGIEKYYDDILKENPGTLQVERDAKGNIISEKVIEKPSSGENLVLYLDKGLQEKITNVLEETLKKYGINKAQALAINPQTGGVLSLVSLPSYDNNILAKPLTQEEFESIQNNPNISFYNRVISGEYPCGSTIKPIIALAALEEGIISPQTTINCQGGIMLSDGTYKSDWKIHGITDLKKAISQSCDVYFYTIGGGYGSIKGLGVDLIEKYFKLFGFGASTGIDLPEENSGLVPSKEWKENYTKKSWYPGDTYNISIGQGYFKATSLQLTMAIASLANGGKLIQPKIAKGIVDENGNLIKEFPTNILKENFYNKENANEIKKGMRETVLSPLGTASSLASLPVTSAAKTGTAETSKAGYYHNWIVVFAPYENPEIVLTLMFENVPGEIGIASQPAKEILNWYFSPKP